MGTGPRLAGAAELKIVEDAGQLGSDSTVGYVLEAFNQFVGSDGKGDAL